MDEIELQMRTALEYIQDDNYTMAEELYAVNNVFTNSSTCCNN
jgi:hypothetical protein